MNLAAAPDRARELGAGASKAAARLYNDVEQELALGSYTEEDSEAGEQALEILEQRFPGVRAAARDVTDPPALSHRAKHNLDRGPEDTPASADHGGGGGGPRSSSSSSSRGSGRPRSRGSSSRSRSGSGRVFERAAGFSGEDVSDAVIGALRFLLLAGLAYQVLQPRGSSAFGSALGALERGVRVVVDPIDPLAPSGSGSNARSGANLFDTPHGPAPFRPPPGIPLAGASVAPLPTNLRGANNPRGVAIVTAPRGSHVHTPSSPLALASAP